MSNSIGKAGYTKISCIHTIHLLENTPSINIRGPTNETEDEQGLLFQTSK
jgi:hypothetical protein